MTPKFQWVAYINHHLSPLMRHVDCGQAKAALELTNSLTPFHSGAQTEEETPTWQHGKDGP